MLDLLGLEIQVFVRCHVSAEIQTKNSQCSQLLIHFSSPWLFSSGRWVVGCGAEGSLGV